MSVDCIASYELFKVAPRWLFLKITTDNGIVGWGEPNLEGFTDTVAAATTEMMDSLKGEDATRIQRIWQKIYRQKFYCGGPILMSALAGIDQCLWDIKGKTLNVPISTLIGGTVRDKCLMYRWCGGDNNTAEEAASEAVAVVNAGYTHMKLNATPMMEYVATNEVISQSYKRIKAVRDAVGPSVGIGLDFHGRVKLPTCKKMMKVFDELDPLFYEEPTVKGQNKSLKDISNFTPVPIATGERMHTIEEFRDLLELRSVSIIQPDVSHIGGISPLLTLARMSEAYEVSLAPHCPLGPVALAACLAVDSCSVNFAFQESSMGIHYNTEGGTDLLDYIKNKEDFKITNGYMKVLTKPGLGIDIDEQRVREAALKGHNWKDREWTLEDGTPTTW